MFDIPKLFPASIIPGFIVWNADLKISDVYAPVFKVNAIIAFALNTGAYTSEILRSAFQTIKPGLIEAGKSLGISNKIIFYKIQIPIAIRQSLPAYGNEMILMMKGTSLASTVTLMDLTGVAKYIISTTFKPIEVFIVAGSIYLLMTFIIHNVIKYLEKKYSFQR